ncbi:CUB and sushi domain-containing protein 1-like isoform X1 [Accipiter gentilis]|uniref:CUB and sushi domain-containing protein 1-like isoform X1 n=1 Tax=Astur gentilis TaxID=8957 RepID=UPI00210F6CBF|nr:CUB and sushi domain-containing protein 1-like isoform X1 [Accipiter gentilis]
MGLGLLFLTVLAMLVSCEDPEGDLDTYWSGTAPICVGGCKGKHKELKRSQCGNGSCCWLGYKSFCRVNCGRPEADFNSVVYGNDWWVGSVVRYSCRPGFLLLGDPASACQSNGRWTPKPTCLPPRPTWGHSSTVAASRSQPVSPSTQAGPAGSCAATSVSVTATSHAVSPGSGCPPLLPPGRAGLSGAVAAGPTPREASTLDVCFPSPCVSIAVLLP